MFRSLLLLCVVTALDFTRRDLFTTLTLSTLSDVPKIPENVVMSHEDRSLYFYGSVTDESCFWLSHALEEMATSSEPIHLHIQSTGGSLVPTFNVIDTIIRLQTPVYTYVDGFAASAASLISVVGKKRFMGKHSLTLLHQLSSKSEGTYESMKDEMSNLNTYMEFVKEIYLEHSKLNATSLEGILSHDNRWLNSSTTLKYGLVDKII